MERYKQNNTAEKRKKARKMKKMKKNPDPEYSTRLFWSKKGVLFAVDGK